MAGLRPTLRTVADAAGVSPMTVSNAYNRPDQLSVGTRDRVLLVAAQLGYAGPSPAGRSLRRGRSDTVGVLLTERLPYAFADPGLLALLHGLASGLAEAGQALLLVPTDLPPRPGDGVSAPTGALSVVRTGIVQTAIVDALVLCSLSPDDPAVTAAIARRIPLVTVGSPRLPGVPFVGIDNEQAAAAAALHLFELGHRRIGVVSVPRGSYADGRPARTGIRDRVTGFLTTLRESGISPGSVAVIEASGHSQSAGAIAAAELLRLPPRRRPTAIFAVTDVLALGVLQAASELGLDVPTALSVVGFDDIAEASRTVPPLTTVAQPLFEQGRATAALVLAQIAGRTVRSPRLRTHLTVRGTTGPPRSGHRSRGQVSR
jgi:DNA-binding LacI/PurR family transcriptional regulator